MNAFSQLKTMSALVVEDSHVQRKHAVNLLLSAGVSTVHEATDGRHALEVLASMAGPLPDFAFIDLEMPGMDGIELIQSLKKNCIDIPVVVMSSRDAVLIGAVGDMAAALGIRVLAGLSKPLTSALVQKVISSSLSGTSHISMSTHQKRLEPAEDLDAKALEAAIHSGGITVHYQPKLDIRSGVVCGMEALARWHHGERGMIPPDRFIALAEREGLIHSLTLSVISQAFAQVSDWNAQGGKLRLTVAINLSPRLLDRDGLIDDIITLLNQHHLEANQITFEVTEGSLVSNLGAGLGLLTRLRLKGFGLSIDDYGTGFSSMQQLARIPFTELKIDRSFVHGAHARSNLKVILQSALDMAKQLDLVTVAEGIETIEDWHLLQEFGCVIGQGYLIAKPMPANAISTWLNDYRLRDFRTGVAM